MNAMDRRNLSGLWMMEPVQLQKLLAGGLEPRDAQGSPGMLDDYRAKHPPRLYQVEDGVALIHVEGIMLKGFDVEHAIFGGLSTLEVVEALEAAAADPKVRRILMVFDSPGGQAAGITNAAAVVARVNQVKPTGAFVPDMCASAAYYLASQCAFIVAGPSAYLGCIGTYAVVCDYSKMAEALGIKVHVIRSGPMKGAGTEGTEITPEQLEMWQDNVEAHAALFKAAVAGGRGMSAGAVEAVADGRCWMGAEAEALGLADLVGDMDAALAAFDGIQTAEAGNSSEEDGAMAKDKVEAKSLSELVAGDALAAAHVEELKALQGRAAAAEIKPEAFLESAPVKAAIAAARDAALAEGKAAGLAEAKADASKPATLGDLKAAFPERAAFVLDQAEKGATLASAKGAFADVLLAENKELRERIKSGAAPVHVEASDLPPGGGAPAPGGAKPGDAQVKAWRDEFETLAPEVKGNFPDADAYVGYRKAVAKGMVKRQERLPEN